MTIHKQNQENLIHGPDCRQLTFQWIAEKERFVPMFRHNKNSSWTPCEHSQVCVKPILGGTPGYAQHQVMFKAGYEVVHL